MVITSSRRTFLRRFFLAAISFALVSPVSMAPLFSDGTAKRSGNGAAIFGASEAHAGTILHVEPLGTCGGNANCFSSLQGAIDVAVAGDTLWVADATYPGGASFVLGDELTVDGGWNSSFTTRTTASIIVGPGNVDQMIIANGLVRVTKTRNIVRLYNDLVCSGGGSFVATLTDTPSGESWSAGSGDSSLYQSFGRTEIGPLDADLECEGPRVFPDPQALPANTRIRMELISLGGAAIGLQFFDEGAVSSGSRSAPSDSLPGDFLGVLSAADPSARTRWP